MNDIKGYKYIEQVEDSDFVFFIIQITYANGEQRLFQVNMNKEYGIIDSEYKRKNLFEKLKEMGVLDYTSVKEELDLQDLIEFGQEKQGAKEHRPSNKKKLRFTYLSIESDGESDVYNIQIRYMNGEIRKFKVKTNKGSVKISLDDSAGKKALVELLNEQGLIEQDSPNKEIELGTLIEQNGKLNVEKNDIKSYIISPEQFSAYGFRNFHIQIEYTNNEIRQFEVQISIDSFEGKESLNLEKTLIPFLKKEGLIKINSTKTIYLGDLKLENGQLNSANIIYIYKHPKFSKISSCNPIENDPLFTLLKKFTIISVVMDENNVIYNIRIRYNNNEVKNFRVQLDRGSYFFGMSEGDLFWLLENQGLIDKNSPKKIYLGFINYEDRNFESKKVLKRIPKNSNENIGQNYVCSDIHGKYSLYMKAKNLLNSNDTLWILGDATDRQKHGIEIIQDIIKCTEENESGPQVKYILGNHDIIMLEWISYFEESGMSDVEICELLNLYYELSDKEFNKTLDEKLGSEHPIRYAINNGALNTMLYFYALSKNEQYKIIEFLKSCPLFITRQFGDKKIALVHSAPPYMTPKLDSIITLEKIYNHSYPEDEKEKILNSIVWDRADRSSHNSIPVEQRYRIFKNKGFTTIHGHTPTKTNLIELGSNGDIGIDLSDSAISILGLYRIEDGKGFGIIESGVVEINVKTYEDLEPDRR